MRPWILVGVLTGVAACTAPRLDPDEGRVAVEVERTLRAFEAAERTLDPEAVLAFIDPGFTMFADGERFDYEATAAQMRTTLPSPAFLRAALRRRARDRPGSRRGVDVDALPRRDHGRRGQHHADVGPVHAALAPEERGVADRVRRLRSLSRRRVAVRPGGGTPRFASSRSGLPHAPPRRAGRASADLSQALG